MKPENWEQMSTVDKQEYAVVLVNSMRGRLIISQALHYAMQQLKEKPHPEISNIQDMEVLRETLFAFPVFK